MAGFKTHITTSSILGIGYGATAFGVYHLPPTTCILASGLCGVSGMLPDIDSGPGRPLRESMAFAAAVVPMMMVDRFKMIGMDLESIIMLGGLMYLLIRFGLAALVRHYTVHRGMYHSLPACAIFGLIAFLAFDSEKTMLRYFIAGAVVLGFMSHLILDEIWSVEFKHGLPHLKSSFGTAMKLWGPAIGPNLLTYALVAGLTFVAVNDPIWMDQMGTWTKGQNQIAKRIVDQLGLDGDDSTQQPAPATDNFSSPPAANIHGSMRPINNGRR